MDWRRPRFHGSCHCGWRGSFKTEDELKYAVWNHPSHELRLQDQADFVAAQYRLAHPEHHHGPDGKPVWADA